MENKKRILLITTGGTIASAKGKNGLSPLFGGDQLIENMQKKSDDPEISVLELFQIDSSDMQPENWVCIAKTIEENKDFDGFVITHGTDTMAYTSAMLSWMLGGIRQPVILTGSQLPMDAAGSDGPDNLKNAIKAAAEERLQGVFVAFGGKLIRGECAHKLDSVDFNAFVSVNCPDAGRINKAGEWELREIPEMPENKNKSLQFEKNVALVKLFPGISPSAISSLAESECRAVLIEAFGVGNIPEAVADAIKTLTKKGIPVVITTQCTFGGCCSETYEAGARAVSAGAISAGKLSTEAALTKMMWLLGQGEEIKF